MASKEEFQRRLSSPFKSVIWYFLGETEENHETVSEVLLRKVIETNFEHTVLTAV
jgi:hypothetical protein